MPTQKAKKALTRSEVAVKFGKWVKDKRRDGHLTQNEAALRAEISRTYLARIEAGEIPSRSLVIGLAHALNVPEQEALMRAGWSSGLEEEEVPMAMITFRLLSPAAQMLIEKHIDELRKFEELQSRATGKTARRH